MKSPGRAILTSLLILGSYVKGGGLVCLVIGLKSKIIEGLHGSVLGTTDMLGYRIFMLNLCLQSLSL